MFIAIQPEFKISNLFAGSNHAEKSVILNQEQKAVINNLTHQFNCLTLIKRYIIIGATGVGKSVVIYKSCEDYKIILEKE